MDQRYNNNRASRSAYNYDNDRPYAAQNRSGRPGQDPSSNVRSQYDRGRNIRPQPDYRQNVSSAGRSTNGNTRPQRPQEPRNVNPRAVKGDPASGRAERVPQREGRVSDQQMRNGRNVRPSQSSAVKPGKQSRPSQGGNVRSNNTRDRKNNRPQQNGRNGARPEERRRSAPQKKPDQQARSNGGWVYPEGYRPAQQRRPDPKAEGYRPSRQPAGRGRSRSGTAGRNDRRQPQRRAEEKKPIIVVDWQRVGVILLAVFGRFMICLCAVCIVMGIIYRNMFYSDHEPPADKVTYSFVTTEGEGDDAETYTDTLTFDGSYSYSGDELMISFSEVSKWLGTAQIGDVHSMRFVLGNGTDTSEDVVFHYNSQNAFINGAPIVMKTVARFDNGEIWVPLSFVSDYVTGIEIVQETDSVILSFTGEEVSFILRPSEALPPVEQPEE